MPRHARARIPRRAGANLRTVRGRGFATKLYIDRVRQSAGQVESDTVDTLVLDLLEWIGPNHRPYAEVLEAWRTSCPRLPVWENAIDRGFIARHYVPGDGALISVSPAGTEHLRNCRQPARPLPARAPLRRTKQV